MRTRILRTLAAALLASVSTGLLGGCASAPQTETRVLVPEVVFPKFPAPPETVFLDENSETVEMPLEYFTRIYEYMERVEETRRVYESMKKLYEGEKKE